MSDGVVYIISITLLIVLSGLALWIARQSLGGAGAMFFQNKQKRLGLVEAASVDGRRRLLLVRRDNIEHLILTGGPIDLVVETGIQVPTSSLNGLSDVLTRTGDSLEDDHSYMAEDEPLTMQRDRTN